jgi:hypothetical protein
VVSLALSASLLAPSSSVSAATGINHQINFQGKLVNPDGTNVTDGSYSIVYSIYSVPTAGAALWTETQTVTLANGIFQVNLGSVTPLPGSVDFNTDNIYLGIKVGADAEMTPRVQFTSVPQAFNAEKLGGVDKTGFIQNTTSPQTASFNVTGSGAIGTTLAVTGATTLSSTLAVTGTSTFTGALTANGGISTTTLSASGNIRGLGDNTYLGFDAGSDRFGIAKKIGSIGQLAYGSASNFVIGQSSGATIDPTTNTFTSRFGIDTTGNVSVGATTVFNAAGLLQSAAVSGTYANLTGTGALTTGSIAAGFGTISTANTITGTTLNGTTGINTGAGAGTLRLDASGNLSNIGTIAASGAVTAGTYNGQTISSAANFTGTVATAGALSVNTYGSNFGTTTSCCSSEIPTLGVSELTSSNGRPPSIQFHSGGFAEAYLRLDKSRTFAIGDSQGFGAAFGQSMNAPGTPTLTAGTAGTLATGTYYYNITAIGGNGGETTTSAEVSVAVTGPSGSVAISWSAPIGAISYRVYRGTTAGGESVYYSASTTSYTDTGAANTAGTVPLHTKSYVNYLSQNGSSYIQGGSLGIGTATPSQKLDVQGGNINTSGSILTGGTARLDANGNLTNIGTIAASGAVTAGTYNGQTISSAASFTGTLAVAGATTLTGVLTTYGGVTVANSNFNQTGTGTLSTGTGAVSLNGNTSITGTTTLTGALTANGGTTTTTLAVTGNLTQTAGATISAGTGYKINGAAAAAGTFLRGDGTNFVASTLQSGDITGGSTNYIQNTTTQQAGSNFNVSGAGVIGTTLAVGGTSSFSGSALFKNTADSSTAFQVQCASCNNTSPNFVVDTANNNVSINTASLGVGAPALELSTATDTQIGIILSPSTGASTADVIQVQNASGANRFRIGHATDYTSTTGTQQFLTVNPVFNPTASSTATFIGEGIQPTINFAGGGTGNSTALLINPIYTAAGGGANLLVDAQNNGTSVFKIDRTGATTLSSTLAVSGLASLNGGATVTGSTNINTTGTATTTIGNITGATAVNLNAGTGNINLGGNTVATGTITVQGTGSSSFVGSLGVGTATPTQKLEVNGNIRLDQVAAPAAPTVAINAVAGNLTGAYYYSISFVTASGETETGALSASVSPSAQQINLSAIPTSPDARVTSRNIYRTTSGGSYFLMQLLATIANNTTTTYTDNLADASLGAAENRINTTGGILYNGSTKALVVDNATTAVGLGALSVNAGHGNTALGINALQSNTTGYLNAATGINALQNNTTGYLNTATGAYALRSNTTGTYNTAIGTGVQEFNTTGLYNTATGAHALQQNTTGNENTANGVGALNSNTTGNYNTSSGVFNLYYNTTGSNNTTSGFAALQNNTTGINNTADGYQAGYTSVAGNANTTGSNNSFFGYSSGPGSTTQLQNASSIGANSTVNQSDSLALGCVNGVNGCTATTNIGVGTAAPFTQFVVSGKLPTSASGSVATGATPQNVTVQGRYAYVVNYTANTLQIIDVSNPAAPTTISTTTTGASSNPYYVAVQGRYAYVVNATANTLKIFDVSNPTAPTSVGSVATGAAPDFVVVVGSYAYVTNLNGNTLQIFDVRNPTAPTSISSTSTGAGSAPNAVTVQGRYAYVVNYSTNTFQIFDVNNPAAPTSVGLISVGAGYNPIDVKIQGRYAYVINTTLDKFQIFDVSNPASPTIVSTTATGAGPSGVNIQGRYAYIVNYTANTLQIFDVSNPAAPTSVGSVTTGTGTSPAYLTVQGRYAYVTDYAANTLQTFDLGGAYTQSLEVGALETSTLTASRDVTIGGSANIIGSLSTANFIASGSASIAGGVQGFNAANATLKVGKDVTTLRSINAAGTINASGADYAEYIPWTGAQPVTGSIVSYGGSSYVVSSNETAAFVGNDALAGEDKILVTFAGQVPVRVTGTVAVGDILISNGDGTAKAVTPGSATIGQLLAKLAIAQESSADTSIKLIKASVGTTSDSVASALQNQSSNLANVSVLGTATVANLNVSGTSTLADLLVTGNATVQGTLTVGTIVVSSITVSGHIVSTGQVPTLAVGVAAGSSTDSRLAPSISDDGTDTAGTLTIVSGQTVGTAGILADVSFNQPFNPGTTYKVALTSTNDHALDIRVFVQKTATGFQLVTKDTAAPGTTYSFDYIVIGAQQVTKQ